VKRRLAAGAAILALAGTAAAAHAKPDAQRASTAGEPVLGSPDYVAGGSGFGTVAPAGFFNGGVPSGRVTSIKWTSWGKPTAYGRGTGAIYRPQGGYYPPVRIRLRVSVLGTCPGQTDQAYTTLEFRYPQWPGGPLGSWRKWSASRTICDYADTDPAYDYPKLGPGVCKSIGEYGEPGSVQSIATYRIRCLTARRGLAAVRDPARPVRCSTKGCTIRAARMRCRLYRVRSDEFTGTTGNPVQRVVCRRGAGTLSAFLVLGAE
jgi:hypothetical protein